MNKFAAWLTDAQFHALGDRERALIVAAYFCDTVKVREEQVNRGYWVTRFLAGVGLGPGYAWCAAFVTYCIRQAGYTGDLPKGAAAVQNWVTWAKATGRLVKSPSRGDLGFLSATGPSHIFFVVSVDERLGVARTIEGNTNAEGAREGNGVFRRTRKIEDWHYIQISPQV